MIGALQAVERLSRFFFYPLQKGKNTFFDKKKRYRNEGIAEFLELKESAARVHIGGCSFLSLSVRKSFFFFLDVKNAVDIVL